MAALGPVFAPRARLKYLALSAIVRRQLSNTAHSASQFQSGHTSSYDPNEPTLGPLSDTSNIGAPKFTPTGLKQHLDQFVVGQDRSKKVVATAVYNHYLRVLELERQDAEDQERWAKEERRRMAHAHPVEGRKSELKRGIVVPTLTERWDNEDEYPGQQQTTLYDDQTNPNYAHRRPAEQDGPGPPSPFNDTSPLMIEKSNVLLLGPSGVGKTLMVKTLARALDVPFSISDCTAFTQAGYIGEDAEVCVQRLLAASNYDITKCERGIIVLDEIDKIATAKVSHGKDVSGEGVQQALLKIIEGTTLQIQAKQERSSPTAGDRSRGQGAGFPTNSPLSGGNMSQQSSGGNKGETYNVRTDNILFIFAGAFNGLHKITSDRFSRGSIGFGAQVRAPPGSTNSDSNLHETVLIGEDELFEKHLPYYSNTAAGQESSNKGSYALQKRKYNILDLVEPQDLQKYGLIPELVGRIPVTCALSSLDVEALVKVLTEPRNSLVRQKMKIFALSNITLGFTMPALYVIAQTAAKMNTGARGLNTVMERLLLDANFETPRTKIKYVLINESVANRKSAPIYFAREHATSFHESIRDENDAWEQQRRPQSLNESKTFEEYREKAAAAGSG